MLTMLAFHASKVRMPLGRSLALARERSADVAIFVGYASAIEREFAGRLAVDGATLEVQTRFGPGLVRSWRVADSPWRFQLWIVPVCRSTGSLVVGLAAHDVATEREQNAWVKTLEPLGNASGLCAVLDP